MVSSNTILSLSYNSHIEKFSDLKFDICLVLHEFDSMLLQKLVFFKKLYIWNSYYITLVVFHWSRSGV